MTRRREYLAVGTKVRSLNWLRSYGEVIGWEETLELVIIRWDGTADYGPEACEPQEYEIVAVILEMQAEDRCPPCENNNLDVQREYRKRVEIANMNQDIAVEQAIDKMWRLA